MDKITTIDKALELIEKFDKELPVNCKATLQFNDIPEAELLKLAKQEGLTLDLSNYVKDAKVMSWLIRPNFYISFWTIKKEVNYEFK